MIMLNLKRLWSVCTRGHRAWRQEARNHQVNALSKACDNNTHSLD